PEEGSRLPMSIAGAENGTSIAGRGDKDESFDELVSGSTRISNDRSPSRGGLGSRSSIPSSRFSKTSSMAIGLGFLKLDWREEGSGHGRQRSPMSTTTAAAATSEMAARRMTNPSSARCERDVCAETLGPPRRKPRERTSP